ncbi:hypothetical protein [Candidatus Protochlamydia amoebophila]|uniref:Uncharacterized protein n=1 Tax=Candidatus Protochlamydia amoebophila TaxID=362787 RepID=A0A0C1JM37_9BACT|nr:hypothetical protein [Candidatus Protochlamydia amoebophila]KIC72345.1 hypothetical protein DB44_CK00180 [Candidatus Protochlamydia amoebophila]
MLDRIQYYTNHTLVGSTIEAAEILTDITTKIAHRVALDVIIQSISVACLLYLHPNLFLMGGTIGIVLERHVREIVEKVNIIYSAQKSFIEQIAFWSIGTFVAVYTLPTSIVIATLYYSAKCGTYLYHRCKQRQQPNSANAVVP